MKLSHFTLLSIGAFTLLSGCHERGKLTPNSENSHLKKSQPKMSQPEKREEKMYDFPVLSLSANQKKQTSPASVISSNSKETNATSNTLRFPKMAHKPVAEPVVKSVAEPVVKPRIKPTLKPVPKPTLKPTTKPIVKIDESMGTPKVTKPITYSKKIDHRRKRKSRGSAQIPILSTIIDPDVSLQDIPILNKILPKSTEKSRGRLKKYAPKTSSIRRGHTAPNSGRSLNSAPLTFSGGTSSNQLDMAKIRIETDNYQTNIVLDSYKWVGYNAIPAEPAPVSGTYFFQYEPTNNRIVATIKGYNTFSALLTKQDELLKSNPMIKGIYIDRYIGDDAIRFIIELKRKARVNIIDVEDPGSIIVELYPLRGR